MEVMIKHEWCKIVDLFRLMILVSIVTEENSLADLLLNKRREKSKQTAYIIQAYTLYQQFCWSLVSPTL